MFSITTGVWIMVHPRHLRFLTGRWVRLNVLLVIMSVIPLATSTQAQEAQGSWQTWVLESPDQFRVGAPPDDVETTDEITQLMEMAASSEAALQEIAYWNTGPAVYRWNQIALDAMLERGVPAPAAFRNLALLHAAIHDATVAAWDSKLTYNRPRPADFAASFTPLITSPTSPSYPSEYAVTAGAAAAMLSWIFPDSAQTFEAQAEQAVNSRLAAGVEYPSDIEAGFVLGRQVAALVIAYGEADGFTAAWEGNVPTEPGYWTGENPAFPMAGTWKPWVMKTPDEFRPVPPYAYDTSELAKEMDELRKFERTPVTNAIAMFWEYGAGGRHVHWYWNDVANQLVLAAQWEDEPLEAARAYALMNIAGYDSVVGCWDAKYTYWAMRPFQLDTEFTPLFNAPNHPSYPSAHSCMSSAAGGVLAHLFPADSERLMRIITEIGEARIWAGIHFRSDIEAGQELGQNVATRVIEIAGQ
jgi:membrane-associated phospholipid phosphatase